MSLVTTPTRQSPASSRHSAAIRLLLPDPTGPPMPTRMALAGKEALPLVAVWTGAASSIATAAGAGWSASGRVSAAIARAASAISGASSASQRVVTAGSSGSSFRAAEVTVAASS